MRLFRPLLAALPLFVSLLPLCGQTLDSLRQSYRENPGKETAQAVAIAAEKSGNLPLAVKAWEEAARRDSKLLPRLWNAYYRDYQIESLEASLQSTLPRRGSDPHARERTNCLQQLSLLRRLLGHVSWIEIVDTVALSHSELYGYLVKQGLGVVQTDSLGLGYISERRDRYILPMSVGGLEGSCLVVGSLLPGQSLPADQIPADAAVIASIPDSLRRPSYPFLAPDGITLYFSAESNNGLGKRDLYMTRPGSSGAYLAPVPLGLPYNSPGTDLLLAFNADTSLGYLVSDRFASEGQVTVYRFVCDTNETREVPSNDPALLRQYGMLRPYRITQRADTDYAAIRQTAGSAAEVAGTSPRSPIVIAPDVIYHSKQEFRSVQAAKLYEEYLIRSQQFERQSEALAQLRIQFRNKPELREQILSLEAAMRSDREALQDLLLKIRRLEHPYL